MVNISNLTLHVGGTAQINAALYNSDGSISTTTPGLIWQSANTSYATVTSGLVTAIDTGFTTVTVTDGLHGILVVNVNIVGNGTVIPNTATQVQWSFKGNVLLMQPGTTQTISNYTVYNSAGKVLPSVNLTFVAPSASGLSFSGNSVTAGTTTGSFEVKAVSGTDTLANTLNVVVGAATDTSYSLQVVQGTFPAIFFSNNLSSNTPLLISVTKCWYSGGVPAYYTYITSPDKILIRGDGSVVLNAQGLLSSVEASTYLDGCSVLIYYKNVWIVRHSAVAVNCTGNWGVKLKNGDTYNFCLTQTGDGIYYNGNVFYYGGVSPQYFSGTYYIMEKGKQVFFGNDNSCSGTAGATLALNNGLRFNKPMLNYYNIFNSANVLTIRDGNGNQETLQRGAGDCTGNTTQTGTDSSFATWTFNGTVTKVTGNAFVSVLSENIATCGTRYSFFINQNDSLSTGDNFYFYVSNMSGTGTYSLKSSSQCVGGVNDDSGEPNGKAYDISTGSLVITEFNSDYIAGTFNYSGVAKPSFGTGTCTVSGGSFKVHR